MSRRADDLARLLDGRRGVQVRLTELWSLFDEVDPASQGSVDRRQHLRDTLDELERRGRVQLRGRTRDGRRPVLPTMIVRVDATTPPEPVESRPWHPRLREAVGQPDPRGILRAVSDWLLRRSGEAASVPLRERAYEITGDEKAFDGRLHPLLSLDLLSAYRVTLPLHRVRVGDGPTLLVVENSTTFDSLVRLSAPSPGPVGEVGWGAGAGFESSVLSLREHPPRAIRYFGDLDADGLRIPAAASVLAEDHGLPPVRPATGLYELLFTGSTPQARDAVEPGRAQELTTWLDPRHRDDAAALLVAGGRLAQEAVGLRVLTGDDGWQAGLGGS